MRNALLTLTVLLVGAIACHASDYALWIDGDAQPVLVEDARWGDGQDLVPATDDFGNKSVLPGATSDGTISFKLAPGVVSPTSKLGLWISDCALGKASQVSGILVQVDKKGNARGIHFDACQAVNFSLPEMERLTPRGGPTTGVGVSWITAKVAGKKLYVGNLPFSATDARKGYDKYMELATASLYEVSRGADGAPVRTPIDGVLRFGRCETEMEAKRTSPRDLEIFISGSSQSLRRMQEWFGSMSKGLEDERTLEVVYFNSVGEEIARVELAGCGLYSCGNNSDCDDDGTPDLRCVLYVERWQRMGIGHVTVIK